MQALAYHTVLGSTGNIGTPLAKKLQSYTENIRLVSRNPVKVNESDQIIKADLLNENELDIAVKDSEVVYLVAGITYKTKIWKEQWPIIMKNVIKACKKHGAKLVFFDNMYCYEHKHLSHLTEDTPVGPTSEKGKVRAEIAQMILDEIDKGSLTAMIVRAANFYGPNSKMSFLDESVISKMKAGKTPQWLYTAKRKHSITYIPDAAYATAFLAQQDDAWNQVWHLPTSDRYPTGEEIAKILAKELNMKADLQVLPGYLLNIVALFIPILGELKEMSYQFKEDYCFDSSKIENRYGLIATDLEEGLKSCL